MIHNRNPRGRRLGQSAINPSAAAQSATAAAIQHTLDIGSAYTYVSPDGLSFITIYPDGRQTTRPVNAPNPLWTSPASPQPGSGIPAPPPPPAPAAAAAPFMTMAGPAPSSASGPSTWPWYYWAGAAVVGGWLLLK